MEIDLTFHITYDRAKDGSLSEFGPKFTHFKEHIQRMQALGHLPRGNVRWVVKHKRAVTPEPPKDPAASVALAVVPKQGPALYHAAGARLDEERIAV